MDPFSAQGEEPPEDVKRLFEQYGKYAEEHPEASVEDFIKHLEKTGMDAGRGRGTMILPTPGFVVKTTNDKDEKVFVNFCKSPSVGPPDTKLPPKVEAEMGDVPEDIAPIRIPLSLGNPQTDVDKKGIACTVFDAVFNPETVKIAEENKEYKLFIIQLALEWIEQKHKTSLQKEDFKVLKMKYKGQSPVTQHIRNDKEKPLISEVTEPEKPQVPLIVPEPLNVQATDKTPTFTCTYEPREQPTGFHLAVELPSVTKASGLDLEVDDGSVCLTTAELRLKMKFPLDIEEDATEAQFDKSAKVMHVRIPFKASVIVKGRLPPFVNPVKTPRKQVAKVPNPAPQQEKAAERAEATGSRDGTNSEPSASEVAAKKVIESAMKRQQESASGQAAPQQTQHGQEAQPEQTTEPLPDIFPLDLPKFAARPPTSIEKKDAVFSNPKLFELEYAI